MNGAKCSDGRDVQYSAELTVLDDTVLDDTALYSTMLYSTILYTYYRKSTCSYRILSFTRQMNHHTDLIHIFLNTFN